jgi:thiol-disulfide isomerase/thioredoxin
VRPTLFTIAMKKPFATILLTGLFGAFTLVFAADPAPPAATKPADQPAAAPADTKPADPTAPAPADAALDKQVEALFSKIRVKLAQGARTEEALADEIKEFDVLLAAHQTEKTDQVAQILLLKAGLYIEVLDNPEKGVALLKQLQTEFPGTQIAGQVDHMVAGINQQMEANKVSRALKPGLALPEFAAKDLKDLDGQPLSLARFKGKVVLVDFWATWCGPCMEEMPNVIATYKKYHDQGFEIVGVSLDKDKDSVASYLKAKEITWPQYFDGLFWDNKLAVQYGVHEIPTNYLLDGTGTILGKELRGPALDQAVAAALKK